MIRFMKKQKIFQRIQRFLKEDLWRQPDPEMPAVRRLLYATVKTCYLAVRFFTTRRVMTQASALTYSSLLAIVPILAVVFAVARGFGYNKYIEVWFRDILSSQPQVAEVIIGFVNSYLVHTQSGVFLGVGLIFMLYTVIMLVSNIEETFNKIWQLQHQRSLFRTFTDYLAMFFMFPILIVISSGITIFLATMARSLPDFLLLGPFVRKMIDLSPYFLMSLIFTGLYVFMPNTHVKVKNAIVPGILAGIAMQCVQYVYIHSQMWVTGYNAIYGSFAALPLFMLWLQISWTICLFGAQLTYTSQNLDYYAYDIYPHDLSHRYRLMLSVLLMSHICRRYADGKKAPSADELVQATSIPIRVVNDLLYRLCEVRLVITVLVDKKSRLTVYVPAENLANISVGVLIDRLEAKGKWQIDLPMEQLHSDKWHHVLETRSRYLKEMRNVRLEDLADC